MCLHSAGTVHRSMAFIQAAAYGKVMMIRNIPSRCQRMEVEQLIQPITRDFKLEWPKLSSSKCKGYAFVEVESPAIMQRLVYALWQANVPTRQSKKPLQICPANAQHGPP
ncbi:unnamed protein product [Effrenium voratum]|nr:unnamed protein product [Effrenium voratum]